MKPKFKVDQEVIWNNIRCEVLNWYPINYGNFYLYTLKTPNGNEYNVSEKLISEVEDE